MAKKLSELETVEEIFVRLKDYAKIQGLAFPFTVEFKDNKIVTQQKKPFVRQIDTNYQSAQTQ